jgi:salicylate hydroxylase
LKNQHVVVAGGGIGGLAAALALARAGQRVTVLERAAQFADVGAGIQLGPNAIKVLASWGLRSAVLAQACLPEAIVVRSATTGRSISRILLGGAVQQRYGEVYASVHRADLHAALLEAVQHEADVQLHCGEELRSATQPTATEGDSVQVQTSQRSLQANALVAADGVWSSVRQAVLADGAPHATGHAAYRVLLPMAQVPAALRTQHVGVWWAPKVHVVHYPVRGGEFLNLVVLSEQPAARAVPGWASPISHAAVVQGMQQTCPALRALLDSVQTHQYPWQSWHLYDRPAARTWVQGHVALLGDAAHPMLPYLAQGAAMALEDAAALASHAALHSDWPTALQHYQLERKARCERVVATARRNGRIFHLPQPLAMARDAVLALKGTEVLGMPWLYGFGPEAASQSL